jgi:hypothetical protein
MNQTNIKQTAKRPETGSVIERPMTTKGVGYTPSLGKDRRELECILIL